jgi:hypothetical protein
VHARARTKNEIRMLASKRRGYKLTLVGRTSHSYKQDYQFPGTATAAATMTVA